MSLKNVDARLIGIVGKPHGIKGEVNVMLVTDYPDSILKDSVFHLDKNCSEDIVVESVYFRKKKVYFTKNSASSVLFLLIPSGDLIVRNKKNINEKKSVISGLNSLYFTTSATFSGYMHSEKASSNSRSLNNSFTSKDTLVKKSLELYLLATS